MAARRFQVGLTGGIAAGKSLVGQRFAELGAVVVDHDILARQVVEPGTAGLAAIVARFGPKILLPDGSLDRGKLGELVFADADALSDLNAIVHPLVHRASVEIAESAPNAAIVVQMIPLLVETEQQDDFDALVVVDVPEAIQLSRLMARNGLSEAQAKARIASQASREQRLATADFVIDNSEAKSRTLHQVDRVWGELVKLQATLSKN